jgi:hypothetical protein
MRMRVLVLVLSLAGGLTLLAQSHRALWLRDAGFGVFMHVLPADAKGLEGVRAFDVDALTAQLVAARAKYFVLTLGQNSGYFVAPNASYDRIAGYAAGERLSTRDLPMALSDAFAAKGIRLMLYLPSQPPNEDARAQRAFGLAEGRKDQPLTIEAARRWAEVIREWSDRYGTRVSGWWFDGAYDHVGFDEAMAGVYAEAARHGNPASIVAFNPGVMLVRHARAADYTAGELNDPFAARPASPLVDGAQWHALTFLGGAWGRRDTRAATERWVAWVSQAVGRGGAVTIDVGPNWDAAEGPIGSIGAAQLAQLRAIGERLGK